MRFRDSGKSCISTAIKTSPEPFLWENKCGLGTIRQSPTTFYLPNCEIRMTKFTKIHVSNCFETSSTIFSMYGLPFPCCGSFPNDTITMKGLIAVQIVVSKTRIPPPDIVSPSVDRRFEVRERRRRQHTFSARCYLHSRSE